ncbi:MAG: hypothetical protein JXR73_19040 [Candidatus Omnitrophica bacterium]|nr:hypothetical protein [Candidatus Omnitrophota bacterium]
MAKTLCTFRSQEDQEKVLLFYLERIMEQIESGYALLAKKTYHQYRASFQSMLKPPHINRLDQITSEPNHWDPRQENKWLDRFKNAWEFGEYKTVHDCGKELLLHYECDSKNERKHLEEEIGDILAANNAFYIEPDSIHINTFINADIDFVVENRKSSNSSAHKSLQGNPGFYLEDALGVRYRCFVKQVENATVGDRIKLKITNIPGLSIATSSSREPILYLEPRVAPGDVIDVELGTLSHTENSFTFRRYSYDGFLWFKRRGVNKSLFNKKTLHAGDRVLARILYTTEEEKRASSGNITRLGIIKAVPIKKIMPDEIQQTGPDSGAAKALN